VAQAEGIPLLGDVAEWAKFCTFQAILSNRFRRLPQLFRDRRPQSHAAPATLPIGPAPGRRHLSDSRRFELQASAARSAMLEPGLSRFSP